MRTLPWILLAALALVWAATGSIDTSGDLRTAQDSIARLQPVLDSLEDRVEVLGAAAFRSDTVLVQITDTVRVTIARAVVVSGIAADSLRAHADSVEQAWLDTLQVAHAEEVAAVWMIADERLVWGEGWRELALTRETQVSVLEARVVQADAATAAVATQLRAAERRRWYERGAALVGVGVVLATR